MTTSPSPDVYIRTFSSVGLADLKIVGGKNASLGEMFTQLAAAGVRVPNGFAITAQAYWDFLDQNQLREPVGKLLVGLNRQNFSNLKEIGAAIRALLQRASLPPAVVKSIRDAYAQMTAKAGQPVCVAVRSSATAEDLPTASFAGQHESYLNVAGPETLLASVAKCFVSLFNDRAIKYREDNAFPHLSVGLSVGVQEMVRADLGAAGVIFTLEPETGFTDIVLITGSWGLGENIVQGAINPDEFYVFKPTFRKGKSAIVRRRLGSKAKTMGYAQGIAGTGTVNCDTPPERQVEYVLADQEILLLTKWALTIEEHYHQPMDIEWAKDGITGQLFIVQARPETVQQSRSPYVSKDFRLTSTGKVLAEGSAIGGRIVSGIARILHDASQSDKLLPGDVLVTEITNPDWDVIMKRASAIVTNRGGRTSHAAIVARELGLAAVVGATDATQKIRDGQVVTICCSQGEKGVIYDGKLTWEEKAYDYRNIPQPHTHPMLITADPDQAFRLSFLPSAGVGLMRLEFAISDAIRIHPMALVKFKTMKDAVAKAEIAALTRQFPDKERFFVEKLAEAVATTACAFYPRPVIVRMSDFKTNEYANLIGGREFEPLEENPMIGFRGASRYYDDRYREGFRLECEAIRFVRNEMGLSNVKLMIPFCRTVVEGKKVVATMADYGLRQGENGLEIYVMAEIPSNIILAEQFAAVFNGFSIGSNDLTQLTLGIDRDNATISHLFNEKDEAAKTLIAQLITKAKRAGVPVGLCGQAPSDFPDYAKFLVGCGIDSISFNSDALIKGIQNMLLAEAELRKAPPVPVLVV